MKKAIFLIPLLFIASFLLAMPPFPGAGHTHDGSVFKDQEQSGYYYSPFAAQGTNESRADELLTYTNAIGKKTILVILAAFQDLKFNSSIIESGPENAQTHNVAYYNNLLQGNSGLTMRKYFLDQSLNKLDLSFKVLGGEKYTAKYGYKYYGKNKNGEQGNDSNVAELVGEMLTIASKDPAVNGVNLDNCTVMIIHAGPGEEYDGTRTDLIWSHRHKVVADVDKDGKPGVTVGGKPFTDYVITPEYYAYGKQYEATIGVLCHEFGHILGLPDSYDTSYDTSGVGQWSLMAGGSWGSLGQYAPYGSDPAPLLAVERFLLGWLDEEHIASTKDTRTHSFSDINKENKVYTVNLGADQFLLLEGKSQNISGKGMYVPEAGLLITHIHLGVLMSSWGSNTINYGATTPHGIMIVEAVAENYKKNGLGNLWREDGGNNRITSTALFRRDTLTTIAPYLGIKQAAASFLPGVISIIIALALLYSGRRKLFVFIAVAVAAVSISIGCTVSVGTADPTNNGTNNGTNTTIRTIGPDTNYYLSTDNVRSKAGNSGITIYNIKTNADGSGSFTIKRE